MGSYANITISTLNTSKRFNAIETGAAELKDIDVSLVEGRHALREACRGSLNEIYVNYLVSETTLFDALASLSPTGDAQDLYWHMIRMLSLATLATYYMAEANRPGRKGNLGRVAMGYHDRVMGAAPTLATMIQQAIDNDDLTLTANLTSVLDDIVWVV